VTGVSDPTEELDGRFRLEGQMVAGGMGTVYRALDLTTGEIVAVKISSSFGSQLASDFSKRRLFWPRSPTLPSFATCPTAARRGASTTW
jgi:hypothetical protein